MEKEVYIDKVIVKEVENIIEKIVEVPVERIVEVPVEVIVERPVFKEIKVYKEVFFNKNVKNSNTNFTEKEEDKMLLNELNDLRNKVHEWQIHLGRAKAEYEILSKKNNTVSIRADIDYTSQNEILKIKIEELKKAIVEIGVNGTIHKSFVNIAESTKSRTK